jgi:membrane-associated phospholipid phosphatase
MFSDRANIALHMWWALGVIFCLFALVSPALSQGKPLKLSEWLLENDLPVDAYFLGLSWRVPSEVPSQKALQLDLLNRLSASESKLAVDPASLDRMRHWVARLPVTGRVRVPVADIRWLQANPARDPIIQPDHSVIVPQRPNTVAVLTSQAVLCEVVHAAGRVAQDYIEACQSSIGRRPNWAWIAQPDGRVQRFGIAGWNSEKQDEPAPGAWLWAPDGQSGWPDDLSEKLIAFLGTQGPAQTTLPPGSLTHLPKKTGEGFLNKWFKPTEDLNVTASDWGGIGLLQTPGARMNKIGFFGFTLSRTTPYRHANIFLQPFDWLETGFRYTFIGNRPYDPTGTFSSLSYTDKSFDMKIKLLDESAYLPQLAVGIRDLTGTGLFAGEYVVGNKRIGAFDWSLGMGWGYVGGRGDVRNPLRVFGRSDSRTAFTGQPGGFSFGNYFSGPTAWFGGVQYHTPWEPLILKLEYEGNNYQNEPQGNSQVQKSPWNFGAVYRLGRAADLSLAFERGNTLTFGLALRTDLANLSMPKLSDPPRIPVSENRPIQSPDWAKTVQDIRTQTSWGVRRIEEKNGDLLVSLADPGAAYWRDRLDRAAAVLHRDAPAGVDRFILSSRERGIDMAEHVINRGTWAKAQLQPLPPRDRGEPVMERAPQTNQESKAPLYQEPKKPFESGLSFHYQQTLGGPDGFVLFQAGVVERATLRIRDDTWLQGSLQLGVVDNYDKFKYTAPSNLPRVRTFLREYVTASKLTMPNLQATHVGRLGQNHFYSVYGGYLEPMFAGVGAEWLYRPFGSRIAVGVDVNAVQQRDFSQDFGLRDYKVGTGHATLYWDTGWNNVQANISVGRYLAGDEGATVSLSRGFDNGVRIGAFATKTNVSSAQFGEGSFDKGVFISIPFDAFLTRSSGSFANFLWKPLTRDGGAMLSRGVSLYNLTGPRDPRTLEYRPAPLANEASIPADRRDKWIPTPDGPVAFTRVLPQPMATQWQAQEKRFEQRLSEALYGQGFRNVRASLDPSLRLNLELSNERIRPLSLAVGRGARTALRLGPLDLREIRLTVVEDGGPIAIYEFIDLQRLANYFEGKIPESDLLDYVNVQYPNASFRQEDPFEGFRDLSVEVKKKDLADLPAPSVRLVKRVVYDFKRAAQEASTKDWLRAGIVGTGIVLSSAMLDRRAYQFAQDRAENRWLKAGVRAGNALPLLALGVSALIAADTSDPVRSRTGYAALEAGGAAYLAATGLKYAFGRERPGGPNGNAGFNPFSNTSGNDAFPSRHTIVTWAVATPFAEEYNAPWLYGIAAAANLARIGSREHWVSDTVAGSLLGYGIGKLFYDSSRRPSGSGPRLVLSPSGASLAWQLK